EVRAFGALGEEEAGAAITGIEGSHGLALDPRSGVLWISEKDAGKILTYSVGGKGKPRQAAAYEPRSLSSLRDFEPERMALAPGGGALYVIDAGDDQVVRFEVEGHYAGRFRVGAGNGGGLDFGSDDNDIAVDTAPGPLRGDVYVLSGKGDGKVFGFDRAGDLLWEL